jgi:hypothetical protein
MRVRRLAVLIASLTIVWATAVDAQAAPAGGGSYDGDVRLQQPCRGCISLVVANDGLSLEEGYVAFDAPCVLVQGWPSATTLIDSDGAFAWAEDRDGDHISIAGRFTSDGLVHGTI